MDKIGKGILYMGKVSYRPKKNQNRSDLRRQRDRRNETVDLSEQVSMDRPIENDELIEVNEPVMPKISVSSNKKNQHKLDNIKVVGDLECEYHTYIEDYVYTYLYQLAATDLTKESSAVLIGEIFTDSKEAIIRGVIPVDMDKLEEEAEWIDINVVEEIESLRKSYFADQDIIGWMHMQPGYGTMLTMKELREHESVFEGNGTICMLIDAINKIETVFVYEEDELKEQSGYCMYYERNEEMQQFMLDHPFSSSAKEEMKDTVVNQFREIGKIRKAEYNQRKNLNLTVMAASVILIALTAIIVRMNNEKSYVGVPQSQEVGVTDDSLYFNQEADDLLAQSLNQVSPNASGVENLETTDNVNGNEAINSVESEATLNTDNTATNEVVANETIDASSADDMSASTKEEGEYTIYTVEVGDTLADICYKEYGNAKRSLEVAKFNGLSNTNELYVGQELKMPK